MRYVDTNILVRVITGDNHQLATQALQEIEHSERNSLFIHDAVLVELCFVLEFHDYAMARHDIADAITILADSSQITVAPHSLQAIDRYRQHVKLDYADCLLWVLGDGDVMTYGDRLSRVMK
jgi:predicted nucleic-acid-binding protein